MSSELSKQSRKRKVSIFARFRQELNADLLSIFDYGKSTVLIQSLLRLISRFHVVTPY